MERCTLRRGLSYGAFIKTWSGVTSGTPPNGGGGGGGHVQNVLFKDMTLECSAPIAVTQCTYYALKGDPHSCDTSKLKISNVTWQNIYGISNNELANIHCSGAAPCSLQWQNVTIVSSWRKGQVKCANILNQNIVGFKGANIPCNAWA
jgi:galacturan 1,4-alpha-galacturonidase